MADTISTVTYDFKLDVIQTIDYGIDGVNNNPATISGPSVSGVLSPTTTVPVTKVWKDQRTLAGSSETLDLTALTRTNLPTVDMSGLKMQFIRFYAASTNANYLSIQQGAANPYFLLSANGSVTELRPGAIFMQYSPDNLADVSGTAKNILISGTAASTYDITLVFG